MSSASATRTGRVDGERLAVGAVADDRLQRLGDDHRLVGLLVEAVEQLAQLRLGEEEREVLVAVAVDRHADAVQERRERTTTSASSCSSPKSRTSPGSTPCFVSWRRSSSAMFVTIWMCTQSGS